MSAPKPQLTEAQLRIVQRGREVCEAEAEDLATGHPAYRSRAPRDEYAFALGVAQQTIEHLLELIYDLTEPAASAPEPPPPHAGEGITGMYWDNLGSGGIR